MHMLSKKKLFLIYFLTVILLPMLLIACKQQEYIKDRDLLYGVYWVDKYTYVGPALYLYPDGHGRFEYSGLASDWPAGEYEISGENLILKDDCPDQIYTFKIDDSQLIGRKTYSHKIIILFVSTVMGILFGLFRSH